MIRDLRNQQFGRLIAIEPTEQRQYNSVVWLCRCECGQQVLVARQCLVGNAVKSCGCLRDEKSTGTLRKVSPKRVFSGTTICNIMSSKPRKHSRSGIKGVIWNEQAQKWRAVLTVRGKTYHLGAFKDINEAAQARKAGEERLLTPIIDEYNKRKK